MTLPETVRILVIDDQESIHEDFRKIVQTDEGDRAIDDVAAALFGDAVTGRERGDSFAIDSAFQGQEGLERVKRARDEDRPYPMAFVDVRMPPGWDGVETIQRIWEVDPEILVVLCTAYSDHTWEEIIARLGRTDHLLILKKPFDNIEVRQLALSLTKRWHLARQAELSRSQLEQMVLERTRELENRSLALEKATDELRSSNEQLAAARLAADAANRAKSEFLANMSHEIRTPMTSVLGYAELLRDDLAQSESPGARLDFIDSILNSGRHLLGLINAILDMSKIESGRLELERIRCNPWDVVSNAAAMLRAPAQAKGLAVSIEHRGWLPETIETDPLRLQQILVNLMGNAIKFTSSGGVHLAVWLQRGTSGDGLLSFEVADTGIGMSYEALARLFHRFSQGDASTTRKFGGTGLGLAISKRLAEMLGGDIDVTSGPGQGSKFTVTVATGSLDNVRLLEHPEATAQAPSQAPLGKIAAGEHILLAEDSVDNQRIISLMLTKAGFRVTLAENGQVACDKALQARNAGSPYDLILMDMQMPVMEGYEATRCLREAGYARPIVALTAHATAEDRQKCLGAGCDYYVAKPINRKELLAVAADCLRANAQAVPAPAK